MARFRTFLNTPQLALADSGALMNFVHEEPGLCKEDVDPRVMRRLDLSLSIDVYFIRLSQQIKHAVRHALTAGANFTPLEAVLVPTDPAQTTKTREVQSMNHHSRLSQTALGLDPFKQAFNGIKAFGASQVRLSAQTQVAYYWLGHYSRSPLECRLD